jgi:hypothetical protein
MIVDFTAELFDEVLANALCYYQTGETVCGAEDPAVISVGPELATSQPVLTGFEWVRVTERYVNPWKSDTFLEFSNREITAEEYAQYDSFVE